MAIRQCVNGHITGFRHCSMCGTEEVHPVGGAGHVLATRYALKKAAAQRGSHRVAATIPATVEVHDVGFFRRLYRALRITRKKMAHK